MTTQTSAVFNAETAVGNYFISNYPPYSCWNTRDIPRYEQVLRQVPSATPLGLYIHLPFCRQRCHYCYFRVHTGKKQDDVDRYLALALKELELYRALPALAGRDISSVYFGGGSPSYLTLEEIRFLFNGLSKHVAWERVQECTFECDPGSTDREKLNALRQAGVTRITLGFQSLNDEVLHRSGRAQTVEDCVRAYSEARDVGFGEINIDLLAGLPGETQERFLQTVDKVIGMAPDCVTIYQLELTHNSIFNMLTKSGRELALPSWPDKRLWTAAAFERLEAAGYTIGSAYMAVRDPSRWKFVHIVEHFWHGSDLLGIGESSFGHMQGVHYQNMSQFEPYAEAVANRRLPVQRAYELNNAEKLRREMILQIKTGRLDADYFLKKFNVRLAEEFKEPFQELCDEGLLQINGNIIRLTRRGLLQIDALLPRFYLPEHQGIRYT